MNDGGTTMTTEFSHIANMTGEELLNLFREAGILRDRRHKLPSDAAWTRCPPSPRAYVCKSSDMLRGIWVEYSRLMTRSNTNPMGTRPPSSVTAGSSAPPRH
jgi:hypothetical protein